MPSKRDVKLVENALGLLVLALIVAMLAGVVFKLPVLWVRIVVGLAILCAVFTKTRLV